MFVCNFFFIRRLCIELLSHMVIYVDEGCSTCSFFTSVSVYSKTTCNVAKFATPKNYCFTIHNYIFKTVIFPKMPPSQVHWILLDHFLLGLHVHTILWLIVIKIITWSFYLIKEFSFTFTLTFYFRKSYYTVKHKSNLCLMLLM